MEDARPVARGTILRALRSSAVDLWGNEGLGQIAALLPADARRETADALVVPETKWYPEDHVVCWYQAAWTGPAGRDNARFREFIDRMMDFGFGRVRKLLLLLLTPRQLLERASELWRFDHSHGELTTPVLEKSRATLVLRDHPYTEDPLSRTAVAEVYRYAVSLCRARNVEEEHVLEADALRVDLRWS